MQLLCRGRAFRIGTCALLLAFVLSGFEASAHQQTGKAPAAGGHRPAYVSTEGDDPSEPERARLDGSSDDATAGIATDIPNRGLVYEGLKRVDNKKSRCRGAYQGRAGSRKICSHGPDPAPQGVDVRQRRKTSDIKATAASASSTAGRPLPCYGDGTSGPRVQAIYARSSDVPDRSSSIVPLIPAWAANVDAAFNVSATQTSGTRHVVWATSAPCTLAVETVQLSPSADDSLTNTINELTALGYNRSDRKYLIWMDASRYCGIAEIKNDDQPGSGNAHNFGPMFGRVDSMCWGSSFSTEAHELMHMLGGIQLSAPHSSGGWHCTDENDRMCLSDTGGRALSYNCPVEEEPLFDCGNDDYYSTAPDAGSYLATHWNAANNVFLSAVVPDACVTTTETVTSPTTKRRRRGRHRHRDRTVSDAPLGPCIPS